eukprot:5357550-Prymnesium_polylepis.1
MTHERSCDSCATALNASERCGGCLPSIRAGRGGAESGNLGIRACRARGSQSKTGAPGPPGHRTDCYTARTRMPFCVRLVTPLTVCMSPINCRYSASFAAITESVKVLLIPGSVCECVRHSVGSTPPSNCA